MPREIEYVPAGLINLRKRKYQFSVSVSIKPLLGSIERHGIIHPVVLAKEKGTDEYTVVCGYKRVVSAMKLGISEIEAIAPRSACDETALFYLNITDTLSQRELHFIESGNVLRMLRDNFNTGRQELVNNHMKNLGLQPSGFVLDRLVAISSFDSAVRRFIVKNKIPLHVSEQFLRFTPDERSRIVKILSRLRFGTNKVREFLVFIREVSIRDKVSPVDVIDMLDLENIMEQSGGSAAEAGSAVRSVLYKNRFPVTEKLETEFNRLVAALALPDDISISHSKNFEESALGISLSVKNPGRLSGLTRFLTDLREREQFRKLFDL